jgi:hypothetical protein
MVFAFGGLACVGARSPGLRTTDGGWSPVDGGAVVRSDGSDARPQDTGSDGRASDAFDACAAAAALKLSKPQIISGSLAPGMSANVQLTMTDTGGKGYFMYPDVLLSSFTPGVTTPYPAAQVAAVGANESANLKWSVAVASSVARGATLQLSAVVHGAAGNLICPTDDILAFSFPAQ